MLCFVGEACNAIGITVAQALSDGSECPHPVRRIIDVTCGMFCVVGEAAFEVRMNDAQSPEDVGECSRLVPLVLQSLFHAGWACWSGCVIT